VRAGSAPSKYAPEDISIFPAMGAFSLKFSIALSGKTTGRIKKC